MTTFNFIHILLAQEFSFQIYLHIPAWNCNYFVPYLNEQKLPVPEVPHWNIYANTVKVVNVWASCRKDSQDIDILIVIIAQRSSKRQRCGSHVGVSNKRSY
jgi:hypothetical protein